MSNHNLNRARKLKNDEFYTRIEDIENELKHYKPHFAGKVIFMNCDDPQTSNFWRYFYLNFHVLKIKKIVATHYDPVKPTYKLEYDGGNIVQTALKQNGDFRSPEAVEILQQADMVVTNPPFSLFREFIAQLMEYGKEFVVLGSLNAITYKEFFPLIKDNKVWPGYGFNMVLPFIPPDESQIPENKIVVDERGNKMWKMSGICWYTNLDIPKRHEKYIFRHTMNPRDNPRYDNYNAVETRVTGKTKIPDNYYGAMGVPISFINKLNPTQFEILGYMATTRVDKYSFGYPFIKGKRKYARIIIKRKPEAGNEVSVNTAKLRNCA